MSGPQPAAQGNAEVASSSRATPNWQPTFIFDGEPLPITASVRMWAQGEGGRVAQSLMSGLLLPEDIQFFLDGSKDSIVRRLQWHTIAVTFSHPASYLLCGVNDFLLLFSLFFAFL